MQLKKKPPLLGAKTFSDQGDKYVSGTAAYITVIFIPVFAYLDFYFGQRLRLSGDLIKCAHIYKPLYLLRVFFYPTLGIAHCGRYL